MKITKREKPLKDGCIECNGPQEYIVMFEKSTIGIGLCRDCMGLIGIMLLDRADAVAGPEEP